MRNIVFILLAIILSGCILSKPERENRRANRKLGKLTDKYTQLITKDTLIDTVTVIIEEVRIDTFIPINNDVSEIDSILLNFEDKLDSMTRIQLGDEIKYYVTNRQVLEDTLIHEEDGVTVTVWQENGLIRIKVDKPEETITEVVTNVVDTIGPVEIPWYKELMVIANKYALGIGLLLLLIWLVLKGLKILKQKL